MALISDLAAISDQAAADIRTILDAAIMQAAAVRGPRPGHWTVCPQCGKVHPKGPCPDLVPISPAPAADSVQKTTRKYKKRIGPGNIKACPVCGKDLNTHGMHRHVKTGHPNNYDKDELTAYIKQDPAAVPARPLPGDGELVVGLWVRQVKPDRGTLINGDMLVIARQGGLIEVREINGQTHKIDRMCLEAIT